ncbi:pitrilysin family protein [Micromonospora sp. R77]|uniref:M16 family metallopeptidase n=1 Tax=Micromonospora sp. R77 TaxID=2925836 RepID=UPI0024173113|nr:pitrilysin family protein [Micromonospora sp. R77]
MSLTLAAPALARHRLANGLRVVALDEPRLSAVGIAVAYDVGYRTETRPGFAHLFEHLMFQGGGGPGRATYARQVQAAGGVFNGTTHRDHTSYFQALPAAALEQGLRLEADRMRALNVTAADVTNQVAVVTEEIRRNVLNRPYGGFPTFHLPAVLFTREANTHDGYGDVAALADATVAECETFHRDYYHPGNAVLAIGGQIPTEHAFALAERHFGAIPAGAVPAPVDLGEQPPRAVRRSERPDPLAPPALALGWQVPAPASRRTSRPWWSPRSSAVDRPADSSGPPCATTGRRPGSPRTSV